jgi:hypothetical protein
VPYRFRGQAHGTVLLIHDAAGLACGAADRHPILPGNPRRPEALYEQFGKFVHGHRWMIRKWQIAHGAQENPPAGIKVCLSYLRKLRLPDGMSPLTTLTTLDGHDRWPLPLLNVGPELHPA